MKKWFRKQGLGLACVAIAAAFLASSQGTSYAKEQESAVLLECADKMGEAETETLAEKKDELPPSGYNGIIDSLADEVRGRAKSSEETEASGSYGNNVNWTLEGGTLTISGQGEITDSSSSAFAPWYGYRDSITRLVVESGITAIGENNFYRCINLARVELPNTLTELKSGAFFECSGLEEITLPESVTVLGSGAFADCTSLSSFSGKGLTKIEDYAFQGVALSTFEIPKGVTEIGSLTFFDGGIVAFTVEEGNSAFCEKEGVLFTKDGSYLVLYPQGKAESSYQIPSGCTTVGKYAFSSSRNLQKVEFQDVTALEEGAFYRSSLTGDLVLSDKITTLNGYFHFQECENLTSVTFGRGLKETTYCMFQDCTGLRSIDFGDTLQKLGMRTFRGCSSLVEVTLPDRMTEWGGSVFNSCSSLVTFRAKNLKEVTYADFAQCYQLQNVYLDQVEKIYRQAFTYCRELKEVTLPKSTVWVDENAFPKTVTLRCLNTELVPFGNNGLHYEEDISITGTRDYVKAFEVLSIVNSQRAANGLPALKMDETLLENAMVRAAEQAILFSHTRPDGSSCFSINEEMCAENVAIGSPTSSGVMNQWMNSEGHKANILLENANTIGIGCFAINGTYTWVQVFSEKTAAQDCSRPANRSVTEKIGISRDEFSEAATTAGIIWGSPESYQYRVRVEVEKKELSVGEKTKAVFQIINPGFDSLAVPIDSSSVKWSCGSSAASVDAAGTVTGKSKGNAAVKGQTKYFSGEAAVTVTAGTSAGTVVKASSNVKYKVTKAGAEVAYVGKPSAKGIVKIPDTVTIKGTAYKVTSVAGNAFKNNKKVTKVKLGKNIRSISAKAFSGCTKLKSVVMNKKVTSIGANAFYKCTALKTITIPATVKKIGKQAFAGCKKLKTITIKTNKLTAGKVGNKAFRGIPRKAKVTVPKKKKKAYQKLIKNRGAIAPVMKVGK